MASTTTRTTKKFNPENIKLPETITKSMDDTLKNTQKTTQSTGLPQYDPSKDPNKVIDPVSEKILAVTNPDRQKANPKNQGSMETLYRDIKANKSAPEGYHKAGTYASDFKTPTLEEQWQEELNNATAKAKWMAEHTPTPLPNVTPEQLASLGELNPGQLALANSDPSIDSSFSLNRIGSSILEKASIGAAAAGTTGAVAGSVVPGLGTAAGAAGGAVAGAIGGAVYGTFATIKESTSDDVGIIDNNVKNAKYNLNTAATKARKGAPYEVIKQVEGDNIAVLLLAQRQYKEQSKKLFDTKSLKKMKDLEQYMDQVLPGVKYNIEIALQNPNKNAEVMNDYGVDEDGNAIDIMGEQ